MLVLAFETSASLPLLALGNWKSANLCVGRVTVRPVERQLLRRSIQSQRHA